MDKLIGIYTVYSEIINGERDRQTDSTIIIYSEMITE